MKRFSILLALSLLLASCNHPKPATTVELIDTSLSIRPGAENAALDAVRGQIERMGRGDRLILIPVTGDAQNDAGGRILRLQAPTVREAYDIDLRKFRESAAKQFAAWAAAHGADRGRTDLLGSLDVARQELATLSTGGVRRLVIVSDFIEDDGELRFTSDPSLANAARARAFAARLRVTHQFALQGVAVCLGRLESVEFASLPPERQSAIDAFWAAYLVENGRTPEVQIDGLGMLAAGSNPCLAGLSSGQSPKGER